METKLSSKGQVVLPQALRDARGWRPGQAFKVETTDGAVVLTPVGDEPAVTLNELAGCVRYDGPPATLEDIDKAIRTRAATRFHKGTSPKSK